MWKFLKCWAISAVITLASLVLLGILVVPVIMVFSFYGGDVGVVALGIEIFIIVTFIKAWDIYVLGE